MHREAHWDVCCSRTWLHPFAAEISLQPPTWFWLSQAGCSMIQVLVLDTVILLLLLGHIRYQNSWGCSWLGLPLSALLSPTPFEKDWKKKEGVRNTLSCLIISFNNHFFSAFRSLLFQHYFLSLVWICLLAFYSHKMVPSLFFSMPFIFTVSPSVLCQEKVIFFSKVC